MTPSEELHLQAAAYANKRKEAYLDYLKKGLAEKLSKKMIEWIWVAHYEGYRDAILESIAAVVASEREACAQVVEAIERNGAWVTKQEAAAAIRART